MTGIVIQIVPRRAISPEGVGDYARLLAEQMMSDHGVRTIFISGSPLPPGQRLHDEWETHELPARKRHALLETLAKAGGDDGSPILLHLSAYGYHNKGVPFWLASALESWRAANPRTTMATIFHELFATGPIWSSPFWLGALQAHIAKRMQRISSANIATTECYAAQLDSWKRRDRAPTITMPVFSNIGEVGDARAASERAHSLVIFGRSAMCQPLYNQKIEQLQGLVKSLEIKEVIDIGQRPVPPPPMIGNAKVRTLGEIPASQLQAELAKARFGLLQYDADRLAKSTIFAAYCAQGAIPVCVTDNEGRHDGLEPGRDYVRLGSDTVSLERITSHSLDSLQTNAISWYRPHSLRVAANTVANALDIKRSKADLR